jgi:plastocyanin
MKKSYVLIAIGLVLALILSACGGSSGSGNSMKVTMIDFAFQPAEMTVAANKSVTLTIVNNGSTPHDWALMSQKVTAPFGDKDKANILAQKTVPAGQTDTLTFTSPATPGDYQYLCTVAGHLESGMTGTLHVTQ